MSCARGAAFLDPRRVFFQSLRIVFMMLLHCCRRNRERRLRGALSSPRAWGKLLWKGKKSGNLRRGFGETTLSPAAVQASLVCVDRVIQGRVRKINIKTVNIVKVS